MCEKGEREVESSTDIAGGRVNRERKGKGQKKNSRTARKGNSAALPMTADRNLSRSRNLIEGRSPSQAHACSPLMRMASCSRCTPFERLSFQRRQRSGAWCKQRSHVRPRTALATNAALHAEIASTGEHVSVQLKATTFVVHLKTWIRGQAAASKSAQIHSHQQGWGSHAACSTAQALRRRHSAADRPISQHSSVPARARWLASNV
eukprot:793085-Pleurochrysis_carterae.AAC.7